MRIITGFLHIRKKKRSNEICPDEHDYAADTRLLLELNRRRRHEHDYGAEAKLLRELNGRHTNFMKFLPKVRECIDKSKLELETCCFFIVKIETSLKGREKVVDSAQILLKQNE